MNNNENNKAARKEMGGFFKARRQQIGLRVEALAQMVGVSASTIKGIESGRFAWDIDLHMQLCAALGLYASFATSAADTPPEVTHPNNSHLEEHDPERFHGFYVADNLLLHPGEMAIVKLTYPRVFVRFNYAEAFFADYEFWKRNLTHIEWLDLDDKPVDSEQIDEILTDCWNFLALQEREEDRLADERNNQIDDDYDDE